jgi:enamine deaminase RidA (YjgF/YER057c/UK114 family)
VARTVNHLHRVVTAQGLREPRGYAHAVVAGPGRTVHLAGQTAQRQDGTIAGATLAEQFDVAAANVVHALRACGAASDDLVSMVIYTTDMVQYRASLRDLGEVWRRHFGAHYPALAVIGVDRLFDDDALVELMAIAIVP